MLFSEPTWGPKTESLIKMITEGTCYIKATVIASAEKVDVELYKRGNNIAIVQSQGGRSIRIVLRDGKTYVVVDFMRTVYVQDTDQAHGHGFLGLDNMTFVESGTARFGGKRLPYDEYLSDGERVQFFVDRDKLAGIRNFEGGRAASDMVFIEMNTRVPNAIFAIPSDYKMENMTRLLEEITSEMEDGVDTENSED
jgi:hypothetical protein